jgi:flavin-dependent dehydrogenase
MQIGESLPPESGRLLQYLHPSLPKHLSSQVESGIYTSCTGNASVWSSSALEERHAIFNPFGHGLHLNRADFDEVMKNTVVVNCTSESRFLFEKGRFKGIHRNEKGLWNVEMEDDKEVRKSFVAKWVVDATGRKASVATKVRFFFK